MGAAGGGIPRWLKLDYIGRRNTWFAISGAVVVIALGAIAIKGLNLGIDFKGGTQIAFETPSPSRSTRCALRRHGSVRRARRSRDAGPRPAATRTAASRFAPSR